MCHVDSERNCGTWGVGWLHFSILALPSFLSTFCKELWTLCIGCIGLFCFLFLILYIYISTFIFKLFLNGIIGLRCSMVTFVYLIFTFFLSNFWKELRTSGVGWLHDSILSPPSFLSTLQGIKDLKCWMVTFFYLSFTCFFEHFLQGTMDLRHRLITSPQRHLTNSLQTACGHLTIFTSSPPIRRVWRGFGGGYGVTYLLRTFNPPLLKCKSSGARFLT